MADHEEVYGDYYYVVDGKVQQPRYTGFVKGMKKMLKAKEIRKCDAVGRGLWKPRPR